MDKMIAEFQIPEAFPKYDRNDFISMIDKASHDRQYWIRQGMFAFVSWEWITPFSEWIGDRKCLEVMAGRGILSLALKQKGVDIICTDDFSWSRKTEQDTFREWQYPVTEMEELDAVAAVEKYGTQINILIMSWPYMDDMAYNVIKKLYEVNPFAQVIYIGEGDGGCTANSNFFAHFDEITDDTFTKNVTKNYDQWWGIHDYPQLGRYVEEQKYTPYSDDDDEVVESDDEETTD